MPLQVRRESTPPRQRRPGAAPHDAYQYFAARFGLLATTPLALGDAAAPPPARGAETARHIRESGTACIFADPQFSSRLVARATEGTGARVAVLDPLGSDIAPGAPRYAALIRSLAETIAGCAAG